MDPSPNYEGGSAARRHVVFQNNLCAPSRPGSLRRSRNRGDTVQPGRHTWGAPLWNGQDSTVGGVNREHRHAAAASGSALPRSGLNPSGPNALPAPQR